MAEINPDKALDRYIIEKLVMIERDFYIRLTEDERDHMLSLKTEMDVDHYAHDLLINKL